MTIKEYEELTPFQKALLEELKKLRQAVVSGLEAGE